MRSLLPSLLLSCLLAIVSPQWSAAYAQGIESLRTAVEQEGAVFTSNNSVVFFSSGADKFRDLFQAVHEARQTIHMEYFNFRDDSIANTLFDSLAVKARQGVKVRLLYDDFGNKSNNQPIRPKRLQEIRDMGIELYVFDPIKFPWLNHIIPRDHRKIVVIDGKSAYSGGMNVADYYINGKPEFGGWHDLHYRIEGDAVGEYQKIFLRAWRWTTGQDISGPELYPGLSLPENKLSHLAEDQTPTAGKKTLAVINREPRTSPKIIRRTFIHCFDNAQQRILLINPYFTLNHSIVKAIKRAVRRGVDVQIMVSDKSDIPITPRIVDYQAHRLMKAGAKVYYYTGGFHHSKIMMVDGQWCYAGSANLDQRSLRCDYEVNALILDPYSTAQLEQIFIHDRDNHSFLLTPEKWRSFPRSRRRAAWFWHLLLTPWV